ncbi:glycosyltransferase family 4 protein [Pseudazoarcus pumilus]|uniref:Glycosyl transferase family 1 n=1 Tax=Pseudazoarcus pumilus TaxID=2067960 RepID=A0A2I6S8Z1_9RHOO|nr:glycosyltransferase family 4 protein [Pseudazoarcus pumilus]AUN95717.1 hypothetical protein C0099_12710 [Pseudazoarcus pumilus]
MKPRVLLAHNYYRSRTPSGENICFELERLLLKRKGNLAGSFVRHSDQLEGWGIFGKLAGAASTPWNPFSARTLIGDIERCAPDVVHVHNTFPLLSPSIFRAIGNRTAKVLTLHNYRLFCAAAIPLREGRVCTECLDRRSSAPALKYGCYRGSRLATAPLALSISLHRAIGTWQHHVDAFIVLSEFQRGMVVAAGLSAEKVHVKPNYFPGNPAVVPWQQRGDYVVFVGRLSSEKGVSALIRAWRAWGDGAPELRIVGDGPLRAELEELARGAPVRFIGAVSPAGAHAEIAHARLLVLPSECFEGFPMTLCEALALGTPAGVSDLGPLPEIVENGVSGFTFEPGQPEALLAAVRRHWDDQPELERLGRGARAAFEARYTEEANYRMLMDIYQSAIEAAARA